MLHRILSSIVLIPPLLLLLLNASSEWFLVLLLTVGAILLYEWHAMAVRFSWLGWIVSTAGAWFFLLSKLPGIHVPLEVLIIFFLILLLVLPMPRYHGGGGVVAGVGYQLTGVVYCVVPLTLLLEIHQRVGGKLILFLLFVLWATDSGALFTGKWMGQRKFAVHISPSKTVAGFVGGLVFGGLVAVLTAMGFSLSWGVIQSLGIGLILSLAGQLGDLAESMLKREAGVKDSGRLIPGHGGFLDRLDSLLFAVPVFYLVIRLG